MATNTVIYSMTTKLVGGAIKNALLEPIESRSIPYEISALTAYYSPNDSNGIIVVNVEFKPKDPTVTFDLDKILITLVNPKGGTLVWYWMGSVTVLNSTRQSILQNISSVIINQLRRISNYNCIKDLMKKDREFRILIGGEEVECSSKG